MSKKGICRYVDPIQPEKAGKRKSKGMPVITCDITAVVLEIYRESIRLATENARLSEQLAAERMMDGEVIEMAREATEGGDRNE